MRLLVLSHMYPSSFNEVTGIFVHEQVRALAAKGVEIMVVSPVPLAPFPLGYLNSRWQRYGAIPEREIREGIDVRYPRCVTLPRNWLFHYSGNLMFQGIRRLVNELYRSFPFDLIHAHVALPDGYAGKLLSERFRVPLLVTIHGQDLLHTVKKGPYCLAAVETVVASAAKIVLVSGRLRSLAEEQFACPEKFEVVPNGVDPKRLIPESASLAPGRSDGPVMLSASYLISQKGIEYNIRALSCLRRKYPTLRYRIIGGGPEEYKLRNLVNELGVDDRVEFLGQLPHGEVLRHMSECDVFSLPSWDEAFGVVYVEALANGKPVVGCRGEGIEDFVQDGEVGLLVEPRDVKSLAIALDRLLSDRTQARAMGEQGRALVLEKYTWDKNADSMVRLYEEVLHAGF